MHRNNKPKDSKKTANPYFSTDYNNLYNFNPEEETFSNTKDIKIRKYTKQAKKALAKIAKPKIIINNPFIDQSNYELLDKLEYTLEAETETATESESVMGIKTPLDMISIISQNGRKESKQNASVISPFISGMKPRVQDFKRIKMLLGTESV